MSTGHASSPGPSLAEALADPGRLPALPLAAWDGLLRQARHANLLGRLAVSLDALGRLEQVAAPVQPHLVSALRLVTHQRQGVGWECRHLEQALEPLGIPVVLLKGAAYAMSGRRAAEGRLFGDIDLLVPREALPHTEAALMLHGWRSGASDPYDQRYYRQWMHELPPMAHHRRCTIVDVHHNVLPLSSRHVPDACALLAARVPLPGTIFSVLAPCDMVLHSAVHLFHEGELRNGLRDLLDLQALLSEFSAGDPGFWGSLLERASALGLGWPLALALRQLHALPGLPIPAEVLEASARQSGLGAARLAALDALYRRALHTAAPATPPATAQLARALVYLRAHALRMPPGRLALHLGRKLVLRSVRHTSRVEP